MKNPAHAFRPAPGTIPDEPGCYQFKDGRGRVLYVGKAKSLRSRLGSYFQAWRNIAPRTQAMLSAARSVEWIVVDNEVEALHLEFNLIQKHRPRYNVRYRDDKSYPYLVLTMSEEVPRATVRRKPRNRQDRKFGPYAHAYAIRDTLDLLLRVFPVRTCSKGVYERAERTGRPCLYFHIGKCAAPCTGEVSLDEHAELVAGMAAFLEGNTAPVMERLERDMRKAATDQEFERAAVLRDQLFAARRALEKQQMASSRAEDFDGIHLWEDELEAAVQVFFVRGGRVVGRKGWTVDKVEPLTTPELLTSFVLQLYAERDDDVPPLVLVPELPDDTPTLEALLAELRGTKVDFRVPQRGEKRTFLETVEQNAREAYQRHKLKRASDFTSRTAALRELQEHLELDDAPLRIECYDISHLGGTEVVGSMVVFEDGLPKKSDYRRFKLSQDRNDDFAAMREVIRRRFHRYVSDQDIPPEERKFAYQPSLVIIDGGPGQLSAALEGFREVDDDGHRDDLDAIRFVALAKRFEELHLPGGGSPVVLPRGSEALFLVQRVRDEAHRFAVTYQRSRRTAAVRGSRLEEIPGIGPGRRKALLRAFGSVKAIGQADVADLAGVPGISRTIAEKVLAHLGEGSDE